MSGPFLPSVCVSRYLESCTLLQTPGDGTLALLSHRLTGVDLLAPVLWNEEIPALNVTKRKFQHVHISVSRYIYYEVPTMEELHKDILKTEMFKSSVRQQSYAVLYPILMKLS